MHTAGKLDPLLTPFELKHLRLRNRIFSSAHAPSYVERGHPRVRYRLYHEEKAKGGLALTMVGGSTNIAPDSPSVFGQLYAGDDSIVPWFKTLTAGVKNHGAAVFCQITHMGRRTVTDDGDWLPAIGPSATRERAHRSYPKVMEVEDMDRVVAQFCRAAQRCRDGGFDGIELLSHSHLLGQFLSPLVNKRTDGYGGNLNNRMRFVMEVLEAVRSAVGNDFILGVRLTADELAQGGSNLDECIRIADSLAKSGNVDFFDMVAGAPYDDLGLAGWIPPMGSPSAAHLNLVGQVKQAIHAPVFHAGGIADIATARHAIAAGMLDMVGMTRAHIADPHLVEKLISGEEGNIRPCVGMGLCVDRVNQGKDALCGHNPATGREEHLAQWVRPDGLPAEKVVVVGGGPAGMEAARVWRARGHRVVLFEASGRLGGQLNLAARGHTRRQIAGIVDWLAGQMQALGVEVHYHTIAEVGRVLEEDPDWVVVATGGLPTQIAIPGAQHCRSSWDVLGGESFQGDVLLFDEQGNQSAAACAEVLAAAGCRVLLTTPDPAPLSELGPTTRSVGMRSLYRAGVCFQTDTDLLSVGRDGQGLHARLKNVLTGQQQTLTVQAVVVENATQAFDELYCDLKSLSKNHGQYDQQTLVTGKPALPMLNPEGRFWLLRIGDAVAHRGLHAAILDGLRFSQPGEHST